MKFSSWEDRKKFLLELSKIVEREFKNQKIYDGYTKETRIQTICLSLCYTRTINKIGKNKECQECGTLFNLL